MSSHRPNLSAQDLAVWDKLFQDAIVAQEKGEHKIALDLFSQAAGIDGAYADVHYRQGQSYEALGQFDEAKSAYLRALELDTLPQRAKMSMSEAARRIAIENGVWFVDFIAALEKTSAYGIISSEMIYDDVHPSITAQQIMTEAILRELSVQNWIEPAAKWQWDALEQAMSDGSLNAYQFVLRGLKLWEQKRFEESAEDLAKGLEHMPAFVESYAFLADSKFRLGHEDEARLAFMKLADANPVLLNFLTKKYPDISESYSAIMKAPAAA
jgi:tetratricopeptide (TPR) repeat protein